MDDLGPEALVERVQALERSQRRVRWIVAAAIGLALLARFASVWTAGGVIDARNKVMATVNSCPNTKVVLGGYSQGAAVAAYITEDHVPQGFALPPGLTGPMPTSAADHVAAVVLFGKPSSGFLQMIFTGAPPITVGPRYVGKTDDVCIAEDPVCSPTGNDQGAHGAYPARGLTDQAADYAVNRLGGSANRT